MVPPARYLRNISLTLAECSYHKLEFVRIPSVVKAQGDCRIRRRFILNIFPKSEYINNGKPVKFVFNPPHLSMWLDKSLGALYLSDPFVDGVTPESILSDAHRISDRVFISLPVIAKYPKIGNWVALSVVNRKMVYEHLLPVTAEL